MIIVGSFSKSGVKIVWDEIVLGEILPNPSGDRGNIYYNNADKLWIKMYDFAEKEFNDYLGTCKANGYFTWVKK